MRITFIIVSFALANTVFAQSKIYKDSMETYLKKYVKEHEVVKGKDKDLMSFYHVTEKYLVTCKFERKLDMPWFRMESSGPIKKNYRVYGIIYFTINDTAVALNIYQS